MLRLRIRYNNVYGLKLVFDGREKKKARKKDPLLHRYANKRGSGEICGCWSVLIVPTIIQMVLNIADTRETA